MNPSIYLLIALAFATTLGYLSGKRKNKALGEMVGQEAEELLKPRETEYVNIGGVMGHNFTFKLDDPFTEAKGTFTLLPRHSILYLPLSLLISRHDRFYLTLFSHRDLLGEGHIIAEKYFPKMRVDIAGMDKLKRSRFSRDGIAFILLYDNPHLEKKLTALLEEAPSLEHLLHFCCYGNNRNFFIHLIPRKETLKPTLEGIYRQLPEMMKKKSP
jgi:hypothetical protein